MPIARNGLWPALAAASAKERRGKSSSICLCHSVLENRCPCLLRVGRILFFMRPLHGDFVNVVTHLHAVYKGGTAANGSRNVDRLSHLLNVRSLFEAAGAIGIDAVGTLNGVGDSEGYQGFLTLREGAFGKDCVVPV